MNPKFTPDEKFRKMWTDGVLVAEMAAHYGVSASTISVSARRAGLVPRIAGAKPNDMSDTEYRAFKAAWMAGVGSVKMAKALGVCQATISRRAAVNGLPKRKTGPIYDGSSRFSGCEA